MVENFGGSLINIEAPLHGVDSNMQIERPDYFFEGIPKDIKIGHYHSWVVNPDTLPPELEIQAMDKHGHIMALRHTSYDIHGVQFHPESVLTERGIEMIKNWVNA